ncbi:MAG TPA: response regulator transcription factor [Candidatus Eisenbacteria bacterium]|nr:response regulator transcription factor [Candidatus Eisenbacteria bacterium]
MKSSKTAAPKPADRRPAKSRLAKPVKSREAPIKPALAQVKGSGSNRLRILVADELPLDRRSLVLLLATQPDFLVVGEAETTKKAVEMCASLKPAVVLITVSMESSAGRTPIGELRAAAPHLPILAMAERGEGECVVLNLMKSRRDIPRPDDGPNTIRCNRGTDCLQLAVAEGASGTIRRSVDPDVFFHAVRTVALGNAWYDAGTATALVRALAANHGADSQVLSPREIDVTGMISTGSSNKEIAQALGIGVPTVKKHVGHILEKLGVQDRLQIGLYVARNPMLLDPAGGRRN